MMPMQAENNMNKVFVLIGVFVASTTGVFHACKAVLKFFARRFRIGKVCLGQPLVATADVLLPSAFFGPYIAMYVVAKVAVNVIRRQQEVKDLLAEQEERQAPPHQDTQQTQPTRACTSRSQDVADKRQMAAAKAQERSKQGDARHADDSKPSSSRHRKHPSRLFHRQRSSVKRRSD
eukprot:jgi/Chrzof1/10577/Cz05g04040.t1